MHSTNRHLLTYLLVPLPSGSATSTKRALTQTAQATVITFVLRSEISRQPNDSLPVSSPGCHAAVKYFRLDCFYGEVSRPDASWVNCSLYGTWCMRHHDH